jgi:hypothetical protein
MNHVIEVNRKAPGETRLVESEPAPLADGQVRLRVDRFAVTANTVTYAVMGEMLGYWDFFPTDDPVFGRVPAIGWADVVESAHPDVPTGGRYAGWFPMAQFVDVAVSPSRDGLRDQGAHREAHAPIYRAFADTSRDPLYPAAADGDAEDRHALLRGLLLTGFLADEFFAAADYMGAEAVVILSASAKTAIALATRAALRNVDVVGVTSPRNADFVQGLGCYDLVVTYDEVSALPDVPSVSVDIAGNGAALAALHSRLGDRLAYSMVIGKSHHDSPMAAIDVGPTPTLFFAPTEVERLIETWGRDEYERRCAEALRDFVAGSQGWLSVERATGPAGAEATWHDVVAGTVAPSVGRIASLHD